jgi:general stress protein 26
MADLMISAATRGEVSGAETRGDVDRKESRIMDETQKQKLADLFAQQHVAVIVTQGEEWPTATLQAFAETPELDLLFIMGDTAEKFQNLLRHPKVTVIVDARDIGDVNTFQISRSVVQGVASEVAKGAEWDTLKDIFLSKNPFEAPFFGNPALRIVRVRPKRISYTGADRQGFKIQL